MSITMNNGDLVLKSIGGVHKRMITLSVLEGSEDMTLKERVASLSYNFSPWYGERSRD